MTNTKCILLVRRPPLPKRQFGLLVEREPGLEVVGQVVPAAECRRLTSSGKSFDVVILDLLLPDAHEPELVRELLESYPGVSVLVLTGSTKSEDRERALAEGADESCPRPHLSRSSSVL